MQVSLRRLLSSAVLVGASVAAQAQVIDFNDFASVSAFTFNGAALSVGNPVNSRGDQVIRLTNDLSEAGSAFLTDPEPLPAADGSFSSNFAFQITDPRGTSDADGQGADGIVFVIQSTGNTAVGPANGGLGYQGIGRSLGVEFDTANNGALDDFDGNHVGIDLNGNIDSVVQRSVPTRLNNGAVWQAWVDYDGATDLLEVRLAEGGNALRPAVAFLSQQVDLQALLGATSAFLGFTSSTSTGGGDHDIRQFSFGPPGTAQGLLEPSTLLLVGLGLVGLGIVLRWR